MSTNDSVAAVYATIHEAQRLNDTLKEIPSYELYKTAREEELAAFRSICRVFAMHHGSELPKAQRRILDDLREELCVAEERATLEMDIAIADSIVTGVRQSGILKRRRDFFDGVEDLPPGTGDRAGRTSESDGRTLFASKLSKTEYVKDTVDHGGSAAVATSGASAAASGAVRGVPGRRKNQSAALLATIDRIGKEVEHAAGKLLFATDHQEQQSLVQLLTGRREQLLQLREELID